MKILGIDPGYAIMGYGIIEKDGNVHRLIDYCFATFLKLLHPEQLYFNTNQTTAIFVSQARGVAILACVNNGLSIYEYTPLQIKTSITGYGRAEKKQMQNMVRMYLNLDEVPKPDDAADALAAAICHSRHNTASKRSFKMK